MSSDSVANLHIVRIISAVLGSIPTIACAHERQWKLLLACALTTCSAIFNATFERGNTSNTAKVLGAVDAISGVALTLLCAIVLCMHRTIVGTLRIFWLVTLVTSSCSFVYIQNLAPDVTVIPNDITIVALIASGILLAICVVISQVCTCCSPAERDRRAVAVEFAFVIGALSLRFEEEIWTHKCSHGMGCLVCIMLDCSVHNIVHSENTGAHFHRNFNA